MPTVLESLLDPIGRVEFREQYYGREPLLIQGARDKFAGLFTWDDLNRLLNASRYPHPNVSICSPGKRDTAATAASLIEECRAGASILFTDLHIVDPKIGELVRALSAEIGEPMYVTLLLSQDSHPALPRHYDRHDVFALQLYGRKTWSVYGTTTKKPIYLLPGDPTVPPEEPILQCELAPGDVLYVPRGYWHEALAQGGLSVHLALAIGARTGMDFLQWLSTEVRRDVRFRHELPLSFAEEPPELHEQRMREHVAKLGEILAARFQDERTVQAFIEHCIVSDRDVSRFKFPAQLLEAPATQLGIGQFSRPARQRFILGDGPTDHELALSVWGHVFHFPKTARPLVEFIVSRTSFAYDEAMAHAGELTEQGVRDVLDPLLREGILDAGH